MEGSKKDKSSCQRGRNDLDSDSWKYGHVPHIYNETILVNEPGSNEKYHVPKLLLEIPVRKLHNLLMAPLD